VNTSSPKVLVTGANGYIGSHLVKALCDLGIEVDGFGLYSEDENDVEKYMNKFAYRNILHDTSLYGFHRNNYDCIVHLAGLISVEESVKYPSLYFNTNTLGTMKMLSSTYTKNFIFASTAAAFDPVSPYALSKLMAEKIIRQKCAEHRKDYTIFRFFNVAGSDGKNHQIGESTHLIRVAAETAAGKRSSMQLYGTDWDTPDGTCIRDYIHVEDLVDSIVKAIYNPLNTEYECLGRGIGFSCREVIAAMREVSGVQFDVVEAPRRPGDVARLVVDQPSQYVHPKRSLHDMCRSAYEMEMKK